jgi:mannose-6-phosphate isomerase-like protein (cupin superfamily)
MIPAFNPHNPSSEFFTEELCYITELSNSRNDPEQSIASARVAPGITTRWHALIDTTERYVLVSGQGIVEIGDLPPTPMKPLDVATIPAGMRQRITNTGTTDLVFLAICTPRFRPECYQDLESSTGAPCAQRA